MLNFLEIQYSQSLNVLNSETTIIYQKNVLNYHVTSCLKSTMQYKTLCHYLHVFTIKLVLGEAQNFSKMLLTNYSFQSIQNIFSIRLVVKKTKTVIFTVFFNSVFGVNRLGQVRLGWVRLGYIVALRCGQEMRPLRMMGQVQWAEPKFH